MRATALDVFFKKNKDRKTVVIQGLGFVGAAMLTAVARATDSNNKPLYAVIGTDLPNAGGMNKIDCINEGKLPFKCSDQFLQRVFTKCFRQGNIIATCDKRAYKVADILVVDINLDVKKKGLKNSSKNKVFFSNFVKAMRQAAKLVKPSCLIIIESTVPPGTCEKVLLPIFKLEFKNRGYLRRSVDLVHSYERVMPGRNYLNSIISYFRVFSGINKKAKKKAREFFESFIDAKKYPLAELENTTASEIGKVLENSFRAINIALIQEWTEFAEAAGVDLYKVLDAIRKRETHRNIMNPGFGVGGYCLTKDSIIADFGLRNLFRKRRRLAMSLNAVNVNDKMPFHSFSILTKQLGKLKDKTVLIMGVSYLKDISDTRNSPSEIFYRICARQEAKVLAHDPLVEYWPEMKIKVSNDLSELRKNKADAVIFAVNHDSYLKLRPVVFAEFLKPKAFILDANNVINDRKSSALRKMGYRLLGVGKGHWKF